MNNDIFEEIDEIAKIRDEKQLFEIYNDSDDFNIKCTILNLISDDSILYEIFSNEENPIIRRMLLERIGSDVLDFDDFNSLDDFEKIAYIETHSSESLFLKVAENDKNFHVRVAAIYKISDRDFLLDMAYTHPDYNTRMVIYKKLNEKSILEEVTGENLIESRISLVEDVDNDKYLEDIALNDPNMEVRIQALKKLKKPHFYSILLNDPLASDDIEQVIDDIKDESKLTDVVSFCHSNQFAVENAINRISNPQVLFELFRIDDEHVRQTVMKKLVFGTVFPDGKLSDKVSTNHLTVCASDDEYVLPYAINASFWKTRLEAVRRCSDENVLAHVATNDHVWNVRRAALLKISDKDVLAHAAVNDSSNYIQRIATEKIGGEDVLDEILSNASESGLSQNNAQGNASDDALNEESGCEISPDIDDEGLADIAMSGSDLKLRLEAVHRINDENVLVELANRDSDGDVGKAAVKRIEDEDILLDVIRKNPFDYVTPIAAQKIDDDVLDEASRNEPAEWIRIRFVDGIADEDILAYFALNDSDSDIRGVAAQKIHDEDVLLDIFRRDSSSFYVRKEILKNINNSETLENLLVENFGYLPVHSFSAFKRDYMSMIYDADGSDYYEDILDMFPDESVLTDMLDEKLFSDFRILVVRRLVSEEVLSSLALNDDDYRVRMEAIQNPNLCNKETFIKAAQCDHNDAVRFEALRRIDDMDILEEFVNDLNPVMRLYASERLGGDFSLNNDGSTYEDIDLTSIKTIEDENILCGIVKNAPYSSIRKYAFDKITDENILANLACYSEEFQNRALGRITDNAVLLNIALYCPDKTAKRNAVKKIDDEELLLKAVQNNPYNEISTYVIDRLRDESHLAVVALNNSNPLNRKAAVNKIQSQDILTRAGAIEGEELVCTAIVRRTKDKNLLEFIGLSNPCKTVRRYVGSVTDDDELLYKFAMKEYEFDNRREVMSKMTNEEYLCDLLKRESEKNVFRADFEITNADLLIDLFRNSILIETKEYALERIKDKTILKDIFYSLYNYDGEYIPNIYNNERLCASILSNPNFNDMKAIEDFLIELRSGHIFNLLCHETAFDISSIYRIVLNCKSQEGRKRLKSKLKYANEYDEPQGLAVFLGDIFSSDDEDDDEESEERANEGLRALFG